MKKVYIIMTHNPGSGLISYIESLINACVSQIIIVNEASDAEYQAVYDTLAMYPGCTVLTCETMSGEDNYMKAAALADTRYSALGYTDTVKIEYANEIQRESVLVEAEAEAVSVSDNTELNVRVELRDVYDNMMDRFGQIQEVLKIWQPMRLRRMASA